jgi:hypothetical protein
LDVFNCRGLTSLPFPELLSFFDIASQTVTYRRRAISNKVLYPEDDAIDFLRYYLPSLYSLATILAELSPLIFYCRWVCHSASPLLFIPHPRRLHSASQMISLGIFYSHFTSYLHLIYPSLHHLMTAVLLVGEVVLMAAYGFKQVGPTLRHYSS